MDGNERVDASAFGELSSDWCFYWLYDCRAFILGPDGLLGHKAGFLFKIELLRKVGMNRADKIDGAPFHSHVAEGPADVSAYWIYADDNVRLRVAHWKIGAVSKGTVFLFQGRTENIEKYGRTAEVAHKAG